jgi:hypothetical protein
MKKILHPGSAAVTMRRASSKGEKLRIMDVLADHLEGRHPDDHLPPRRQVEERAEDRQVVVDGVRGEAGSAAGGLARAIEADALRLEPRRVRGRALLVDLVGVDEGGP